MCGAGSMSTSSPNTRTRRCLCSEPSDVPETDIAPPEPATATVMSRGKSGMPDWRVSEAVTPSSPAMTSALTKLTGTPARSASTPPRTPVVSRRVSK